MNWRRFLKLVHLAHPFPGLMRPEQHTGLTGHGPDFPDIAGGREWGKFRPSAYPRLTTVAVVDDDGEPLTKQTEALLGEILEELKSLRKELSAPEPEPPNGLAYVSRRRRGSQT